MDSSGWVGTSPQLGAGRFHTQDEGNRGGGGPWQDISEASGFVVRLRARPPAEREGRRCWGEERGGEHHQGKEERERTRQIW